MKSALLMENVKNNKCEGNSVMKFRYILAIMAGVALSSGVSAARFSTTLDVTQSLAVTPVDGSQVSEFSGSVDLNSLVDGVNVVSGEYLITDAYIGFSFSQASYAGAYADTDFEFTGVSSSLISAQSRPLNYSGVDYNYVVDFQNDTNYRDMRVESAATVTLSGGLLAPASRSTYFGTDYGRRSTFDGTEYVIPTGTTGLIEVYDLYTKYYSMDSRDSVGFDLDPLNLFASETGLLEYSILATNEYLDLTSIYLAFSYQLNPYYTAPPVTSPVPVPAAAWLFLSGMVGLVGVARRKK